MGTCVGELRHAVGLSQEALAWQAELDRTYVGGIERGERNVALLNLTNLAKTPKVSLTDLMKGVE